MFVHRYLSCHIQGRSKEFLRGGGGGGGRGGCTLSFVVDLQVVEGISSGV